MTQTQNRRPILRYQSTYSARAQLQTLKYSSKIQKSHGSFAIASISTRSGDSTAAWEQSNHGLWTVPNRGLSYPTDSRVPVPVVRPVAPNSAPARPRRGSPVQLLKLQAAILDQ